MTRYIFPAGNIGSTGYLRPLRFYRTATATRPLTDLTEVSGDVDTATIPNGVIVAEMNGDYRSFCGPDDLNVLYLQVGESTSRTQVTASGPTVFSPTGASGTATVADGGTIAHGLGATPVGFSVTPAVPGRIAAVTAVSSTNLTVSLVAFSGAAVATPEQVTWTANI